ncbi:MAG TPA: alpha/beta hydrolase [Solirubrobacteraceae bacterium]|jgi:pimeloyl-ACP methyl ester carboxylesterase|nr:alpha/beta hydrolase [Solirubrobacteraceae bacterium]
MGGQAGVLWEDTAATGAPVAPLWGELRYGAELAQLLASREFQSVERREDAPPVLLIPGFMAGDGSLAVMRQWLRRRGHRVRMSGIRTNVGCAAELVGRLEQRLQALAEEASEPVFVIGQSRGGSLARSLAVRNPDAVAGLAMLGSPIVDGLAVSGGVLRTVRWVAALGDRGLPGVFSSTCADGECCAEFRAEQAAPLPSGMRATALYSLSDGIVDWRACVDPHARGIAVDSSHCGMSVNVNVYRILDRALDAGR